VIILAELSENLLDAIKIVAESILKTNLDGMITDKGIITDATQKDKDRYKVKIGKTEIIAHSGVKYNINDVVWVYGPEGDYSKGAYIVGKVEDIITEENGNKIYFSSFGNYI
jgi:cobalamin biosynthesis protein CbiG